MDHHYSVILSERDPQHDQPEKITISLKPHQRAGLYKAKCMEQDDYVKYFVANPREEVPIYFQHQPNYVGYFKIRTNVGIIGDIVGYGKTLLALSIIAQLKLEDINIPNIRSYTYCSSVAYMEVIRDNPQIYPLPTPMINTTLVIVPRGPVYVQWCNTIKHHTHLKVLTIDGLIHIKRFPKTVLEFKDLCEKYDVVLIKNTTMQTLLQYYKHIDRNHEISGFARIMVDEAHTTMMRIPELHYKFLWLITSSYNDLLSYSYSRSLYNSFLQLTQHNSERMHYMLIKCNVDFVKNSFNVPPPLEKFYVCKMNRALSAIQQFLSPSIQDKINVNDIAGAIRELGGKEETASDLVSFVLKDIQKEITNKEREIEFTNTLDMDTDAKEQRIKNLQNELNRLATRRDSIQERLQEVNSKTCAICYDTIENPIYLSCSHMFCGHCLFSWIQSNSRTRYSSISCPECRTAIDSQNIIAIVKEKAGGEANVPILLSKEDQMLDIIQKKPTGRFLLFSRVDNAFGHLAGILRQNNVAYCEIKGSTGHMMHILDDFKSGKLKVILLNTAHAGFGIDISCATDVIIYQSMAQEKIQAVGRAQRVGRTEQLTIHNLCYPHEINAP